MRGGLGPRLRLNIGIEREEGEVGLTMVTSSLWLSTYCKRGFLGNRLSLDW